MNEENMNMENAGQTPPEGPTKVCRHCGMTIPKSAKTCPYCRKKQKGGAGRIILFVILAIIIIMIISALAGGSNSGPKVSGGSSSAASGAASSSAASGAAASSETAAPSGSTDGKINVEVGQTFEKDGLSITFNSANKDFKDYTQYEEPDSGNKYIEANFTYVNNGSSDAYVSTGDFSCYADDTSAEETFLSTEKFFNTNLSKGRNVSFSVYFEVPKKAKSIVLEYTSNIWTDEKAYFIIK